MADNNFDTWLPVILALTLANRSSDYDFDDDGEMDFLLHRLLRDISQKSEMDPRADDILHYLMRKRPHRRRERASLFVQEEVKRALTSETLPSSMIGGALGSLMQNAFRDETQDLKISTRELGVQFEQLTQSVRNNSRSLKEVEERQTSTDRELHEFLIFGNALDGMRDVKLKRYLPLQIYLDSDDPEAIKLAVEAFSDLLDIIDITISDEYDSEAGSWFKRLVGKTKGGVTQEELDEHVCNAKRAIELVLVEKRQAEVDKDKADAALKLASALGDSGHGVIGSIVVVKTNNANHCDTRVFELTQEQLIKYRRLRNSGAVINSSTIVKLAADAEDVSDE